MFFAREKELGLIRGLLSKKSGSIMIYGKRKVGKTTLITRALEESPDKTVYYECLKSTMDDNIEGFVSELVRANVLPVPLLFRSFSDVFTYLNTLTGTEVSLRCRNSSSFRNGSSTTFSNSINTK